VIILRDLVTLQPNEFRNGWLRTGAAALRSLFSTLAS
jgi:hypothetical protein